MLHSKPLALNLNLLQIQLICKDNALNNKALKILSGLHNADINSFKPTGIKPILSITLPKIRPTKTMADVIKLSLVITFFTTL